MTVRETFEDTRATDRSGGGYRLRWPRKPTHEQQHERAADGVGYGRKVDREKVDFTYFSLPYKHISVCTHIHTQAYLAITVRVCYVYVTCTYTRARARARAYTRTWIGVHRAPTPTPERVRGQRFRSHGGASAKCCGGSWRCSSTGAFHCTFATRTSHRGSHPISHPAWTIRGHHARSARAVRDGSVTSKLSKFRLNAYRRVSLPPIFPSLSLSFALSFFRPPVFLPPSLTRPLLTSWHALLGDSETHRIATARNVFSSRTSLLRGD